MSSTLRIAIAEDEPVVLQDVKEMVTELGYEVVTASCNGRDLVDRCRQEIPDLVITDLRMPELDGLDAVRRIFVHHPVPVILVSAYSDKQSIQRSLSNHVLAYLVKPIQSHELATMIPLVMQRFRELQRLEQETFDLPVREQQRIGQELHDGVCQELAALSSYTEILYQALVRYDAPEADIADKLRNALPEILDHIRLVVRGLIPVDIRAGLPAALEDLATTTEERYGIRCDCECRMHQTMLPHATAVHLFRIAQEGVLNAVKHAKARQISIRLYPWGGNLQLEVQDDGIGIPLATNRMRGAGIRIMSNRAKAIGGTLSLERLSSGGTKLICSLTPNPTDGPPN